MVASSSLIAGRALARRTALDARVRTLSFAALFGLFSYVQPVAYRTGYPTLSARTGFARSFGDNLAVRLFYGEPHDLLTVTGYTAWRVGGTLALFAAVFGLLAAVRALRTEEDSGRTELVLTGVLGRRSAFSATVVALAGATVLIWLAETLGLVAGGLPAGGSAYLALATVSVIAVCIGVGGLACQLASTRRAALELGGGAVALLFLARVIADTATGFGWMRWLTPLGWAEELRPFARPAPAVLVLPVAITVLCLLLSARIATRRDVGTGLVAARDTATARVRLLSSSTADALRQERTSLSVWSCAIAAYAFIIGVLAKSSSSAGISRQISRQLGKLGSGSLVTPTGYVGFTFIFFVLALSLFGCAQVSAARREEAAGELETLLAQPVDRRRWLAGRLALAVAAAAALALLAGVFTWIGIKAGGTAVPLSKLIEAAANCLPATFLFLGIGALAYAILPRASGALSYTLVIVAFLWNLVAALLGAPTWLVQLSPFAHVALVPAESFRVGSAAAMLAAAACCPVLALAIFRRRDLSST
jgi:polyether ionophore transport system permease protein